MSLYVRRFVIQIAHALHGFSINWNLKSGLKQLNSAEAAFDDPGTSPKKHRGIDRKYPAPAWPATLRTWIVAPLQPGSL